MREHALLQIADHQQDEVLCRDRLAELHRRLEAGDDEDEDRDLVKDARILAHEHAEGLVDHRRIERGGAGDQRGQDRDSAGLAGVT